MRYVLSVMTAVCLSLAIPANAPALPQLRVGLAPGSKDQRHDYIAQRLGIIRRTADTLERLGRQPVARKLSRKERQRALMYNRWLLNSSRRLRRFADRWQHRLRRNTKRRLSAQTLRTFNLEYSNLRMNLQQDNRQYTMISNIMKTKHDTAKNAINNVR